MMQLVTSATPRSLLHHFSSRPRRFSKRGETCSEVTIASFLIPTTRVFKPRRDSFGGLTDLEPMPGSAGEAA